MLQMKWEASLQAPNVIPSIDQYLKKVRNRHTTIKQSAETVVTSQRIETVRHFVLPSILPPHLKTQQSGPCPFTRNINLLSSRLLRRTQHNELWTYVPTPYVRNVLWCNPSMGQRYGAVLTTSVKSYFCGNFLLMRSTSEPIYSSNSGVRIRISSAKPITKRPMPT